MTAPAIIDGRPPGQAVSCDVAVIGAGACGLTAALRAAAGGKTVMVLERDSVPAGSTSLSSGFVPAPATRYQRDAGISDDTAVRFIEDIMAKSAGKADPDLARLAAGRIGEAIEWLGVRAGIDWTAPPDLIYPGHSRRRMHAVPERTGAALEAKLLDAAAQAGIDVVCGARATTLFRMDARRIAGLRIERPDGGREDVACGSLVLASSGYGGNRDLVARFIPDMAEARYFGHPGNSGDAVRWGRHLGAAMKHLSGFQGHGSLAVPHAILITWILMQNGAIQVNSLGERFSNEHGGYSEQARKVLAQPGGIAWNLYDEDRHADAMDAFPDYREAEKAGAVRHCRDLGALSEVTGIGAGRLAVTLDACRRFHIDGGDPFGRDFSAAAPLEAPFCAVRVSGALFHTQGGLMIDDKARVIGTGGTAFANLYAGGGAACGVSGPDDFGYLSGNGLLTAIAFGFIAGESCADYPDSAR